MALFAPISHSFGHWCCLSWRSGSWKSIFRFIPLKYMIDFLIHNHSTGSLSQRGNSPLREKSSGDFKIEHCSNGSRGKALFVTMLLRNTSTGKENKKKKQKQKKITTQQERSNPGITFGIVLNRHVRNNVSRSVSVSLDWWELLTLSNSYEHWLFFQGTWVWCLIPT